MTPSWLPAARGPLDRTTDRRQAQLEIDAVVIPAPATKVDGLANAVLDGVLVEHQPLRRGLVAGALGEEHSQRVPKPRVLVVLAGERAQHHRTQTRAASRSADIIARAPTSANLMTGSSIVGEISATDCALKAWG
jgi:hypothetical protein